MSNIRRPEMLNTKKSSSGTVGTVILLIFLALIVALFSFEVWLSNNFYAVTVSKTSMLDTLRDGDVLYAARSFKAERGDIVIVDVSGYPDKFEDGTDLIIKRLIAVEGDEIRCLGGAVQLKAAGTDDFVELDEPYVHYPTPDFSTVEVGAGEIFVLGDHRSNSKDSEDVGCFLYTDIVGVVPEWAVNIKSATGAWERFRSFIYNLFS